MDKTGALKVQKLQATGWDARSYFPDKANAIGYVLSSIQRDRLRWVSSSDDIKCRSRICQNANDFNSIILFDGKILNGLKILIPLPRNSYSSLGHV